MTQPGRLLFPMSVSPDGKFLIGTEGVGAVENQAFRMRVADIAAGQKASPELLLDKAGQKSGLQFSPDGRWVAYQSSETGRSEVFVAPFPGPGKIQVSLDGGGRPRWSRDGRELFFGSGPSVWAVPIETSPTFRALSKPRILFTRPDDPTAWDITRDGRFLMAKPDTAQEPRRSELQVVTNWFEELKRLAPIK